MSQISLKNISGITSITTPAGVDNQLTLHTNNTTERVKIDVAGNVHVNNHLAIAGVSTFSNQAYFPHNVNFLGQNSGRNIVFRHGNTILDFSDSAKAAFGDDDDLEIYHAPAGSVINHGGTGNLSILGSQVFIGYSGGNGIEVVQNGEVELRFNNNPKLNTTNTGVTVTGTLVAGGADINGDIDVDGHTNLDNVSIAGVATATNVSVASSVTAVTYYGSGANLTGIDAGNTNSMQVLEQFYLLADGRSVSTAQGTVTTTNVTAVQALTDSFATMQGSQLQYRPPVGTKEIIYEYKSIIAEAGANNRLLYSWYLDISGSAILESRHTLMSATGGYAYDMSLKYSFRVNTGVSNNNTTGDRQDATPLLTLSTKGGRWSSSYAANAHQIVYYTGASPSTTNIFRRPYIGITAIGSV